MVKSQQKSMTSLLADLREIELACLGEDAMKPKVKLDDFQTAKRDLANLLSVMKQVLL